MLGICLMATADPLHAQLFGIPCQDVLIVLVNQIKAWRSVSGCIAGGEKCMYELISSTPSCIIAKHTSRRWNTVQDLSFDLVPTEGSSVFRVTGISVSETWAMLADKGTNYCTLYNLIEGRGLVDVGYKEFTNEWICLEHSTANCTIY
ncbi:hypothetical protein IRJ41_008323 [Triplophysa rosa]|uniref:Uncharacterized protein n=1 Tax=Triplophysa rosa TaxID=992332 RepID=A0A9W8C765_TRIRA|nr:hypothetical protein IRJ41_008323 [Triplophysa rosa]